ncbi:MAG: S-adenosylmethionine:tRNA ribosyltransferase-isomerase [Flavobacteriales bacterium]|nr:S-adenosylmethionine:tRNA ribosyltransferase-isomerase [Flavobacteriales bacterium]
MKISDFDYDLPTDLVAQHPLKNRSDSKLLIYKDNQISHYHFHDLPHFLPENSWIIFNNTKVIPARIFAKKATGAVIQLFLLNPVTPSTDVERVLKIKDSKIAWQCLVGNAKKWKDGEVLVVQMENFGLSAKLLDRAKMIVEFDWDAEISFSEVIEKIGNMPLPPYIKRAEEVEDKGRYQTVFAKNDGAVAAPTAGLHFTQNIIDQLNQKHINTAEVTLHVGAGTFKPVDEELVWKHPMHNEFFSVSIEQLQKIANSNYRIATGTTTLRTLESLYWCGVKLSKGEAEPFFVEQHYPYRKDSTISFEESIKQVIDYAFKNDLSSIHGSSELMIMPGYTIRSINALITNFHLPKSTLLLLVSALVGSDWKNIYDEAKNNQYRFLSYGDSSLLFAKT